MQDSAHQQKMSTPGRLRHTVRRLLREPIFHFFLLGGLIFGAHRAFVRDERVIVVTPAIRADVKRRFIDQYARQPDAAELTRALDAWKRDEALYREALREGLDREDATIRSVLADKLRFRAAVAAPKREPTAAELSQFLAAHRARYESPLRYDYDLVAFAQSPRGEQELKDFERALAEGRDASGLGRPIAGGTLTHDELVGQFGPPFADALAKLPLGRWERVAAGDRWLLTRVNRTVGGLPSESELHEQLVADWSRAAEQAAVERATAAIAQRYRFEERP